MLPSIADKLKAKKQIRPNISYLYERLHGNRNDHNEDKTFEGLFYLVAKNAVESKYTENDLRVIAHHLAMAVKELTGLTALTCNVQEILASAIKQVQKGNG